MSRLLIALALVLAACTAPVEPADPVEACVEADRLVWNWDCAECGRCDAPSDDELRERCADLFGDDFAAIEAERLYCVVDCNNDALDRGEDACSPTRTPAHDACVSACSE